MTMFRDPISAESHWLMGAYSLFVTIFLLRRLRQQPSKRFLVGIFGFSATLVYCMSGLFHTVHVDEALLRLFQKWDMTAICLMIAGSCTPIVGILLRGWFRVLLMVGEWLLAAVGIGIIWTFDELDYSTVVIACVSMGLLGCLGLWHYWKATGWAGIFWAVSGVAFYLFGAICEMIDWPVLWAGMIGSHEVFHLATSVGTLCHMVFIINYVIPFEPVLWGRSDSSRILGSSKPETVVVCGVMNEETRHFPERLPSIS
jgi:hemolysin III